MHPFILRPPDHPIDRQPFLLCPRWSLSTTCASQRCRCSMPPARPSSQHLISCRFRLSVARSQVPMACYVTCFGRTLCQTTVMSTSRLLMDQGFCPARHSCIIKRADAPSSSRQPLRPLVSVCLLNLIPNSYEAVCAFLERNNLLTVIRGHEAQDAGYLSLPPRERCLSLIYF